MLSFLEDFTDFFYCRFGHVLKNFKKDYFNNKFKKQNYYRLITFFTEPGHFCVVYRGIWRVKTVNVVVVVVVDVVVVVVVVSNHGVFTQQEGQQQRPHSFFL